MLRDSRVSEHLDTKSVVDSMSWAENNHTTILLKCRPFGRSNNRWVTDQFHPPMHKSRVPVNLGDVGGLAQGSWRRAVRETNARSSRWGREQMRPKSFESEREENNRRSDLITAEKPCNGTREMSESNKSPVSTFK